MTLSNDQARIASNEQLSQNLHLMKLEAPEIARRVNPGQFVHMKIPTSDAHLLRRPFSVYARDEQAGTIDILYQEVGSLTSQMPYIKSGFIETMGPIGNSWLSTRTSREMPLRALLVGGGVGAAPLYLLAEQLNEAQVDVDIVLGAQTKSALVTLERYGSLLGCAPECATDDGSFGYPGFCTGLVERRLQEGASSGKGSYDYVAVCGPEPLMKIVAGMASGRAADIEVSLEKRMACGVGACLSCVVDTVNGKRRSCVDGPIFDASEVVWR